MSSSESSRRFHFIREIASGGFGSVYLTKVIHADGFSRLQAVKLLHPRYAENEEIAARMRDEARLLGWLRHKNIVDVMDLTLIDGRCAVLMEYLEAVDTKVVVTHCAETGTRIPLRAALEMCAAVAGALDAAYNRPPYAGEKPLRVIHRDIKPSNIMVDDSGVVKVLDFGVARAEFDERESKTQELAFGSLEYMPPERLFFEPESPASDVYSLGATLYELIALEKFGKAKLRPKEHEQYFEDRFDVLLDRYPMHQESEDLLHDLLMSMLAFEEPERPTAADCVNRMRAFARRIQDNPLEEWAEAVVPPLIKAAREREEVKSPGSLVGTVLTEDARALDQRSIWDENTGMSTRAMDVAGLDDELTGSLADDARWKALKQATIEDMAKKGELGASRPPDAPRRVSVGTGGGLPPRARKPDPPPVRATPTPPPMMRTVAPPAPASQSTGNRSGDVPIPLETRPLPADAELDELDEVTTRSRPFLDGQVLRAEAPPARPARPPSSPPAAASPPQSRAPSAPAAPPRAPSTPPVPAKPPPASSQPPTRRIERSVPPPPPRSTAAPRARISSPPKRRRAPLGVVLVVMFMLGAGLGMIALAVVGGLTSVVLMSAGVGPSAAPVPPPRPAVVPPPEPPPPVPAPAPAEIDGPHVSFASGVADTTRMKVSCDGGSGDGVDRVAIAGSSPGTCVVQAITGGGERLRARVTKAQAREYLCFVGGVEECK